MTVSQDLIPPVALAAFYLKWRVRELAVFGSTARGAARPDSDVDLLVAFEADAP